MSAKPIIIDCDPGADDAVALFLALAVPERLQVLGVTTVAGNVSLALTQRNARYICELAGKPEIPVYAGCSRPLLRSLVTGETVHGKTGLDGVSVTEPQMPLQQQHAVEFLIQTLLNSKGEITLATLGPLTNIAAAMIQQPAICQQIKAIVLMGGAITQGNVTPSAEFNIYVDPHAAQVVFTSGVPLTMISLDVTHQAIATPERLATIQAINSPVSNAVVGLLQSYAKHERTHRDMSGPPLHDPCVIAYLLQPELFASRLLSVEIETTSELTMGRTVVDLWHSRQQPANANVVESIQADGFYQLLTESLERLSQ